MPAATEASKEARLQIIEIFQAGEADQEHPIERFPKSLHASLAQMVEHCFVRVVRPNVYVYALMMEEQAHYYAMQDEADRFHDEWLAEMDALEPTADELEHYVNPANAEEDPYHAPR